MDLQLCQGDIQHEFEDTRLRMREEGSLTEETTNEFAIAILNDYLLYYSNSTGHYAGKMWASNDGPFNILQKLPRHGVELSLIHI